MQTREEQHRWAIVLAAGEGTRLRALTTGTDGVAIPKQYCSFDGGATLCEWAFHRAERVVPRDHVAVVVAAAHQHWATRELARRPEALAVVQPENRGTGPGILLPLLAVLERDPEATVLVLPSDHYVADERAFARAARLALAEAEAQPERLVLLGAAPEECDPELGWILPGGLDSAGLPTVAAFVEKPDRATAAALQGRGGLVNTFVFAVRASTLLDLCRRALPEITARLAGRAHAGQGFGPAQAGSLDELVSVYADLPAADFSRSVLEQAGSVLRVLRMEPCGWSDLGTPRRVAACLRQLRERHGAGATARSRMQTGSLAARALVHEQRHRFELAF